MVDGLIVYMVAYLVLVVALGWSPGWALVAAAAVALLWLACRAIWRAWRRRRDARQIADYIRRNYTSQSAPECPVGDPDDGWENVGETEEWMRRYGGKR